MSLKKRCNHQDDESDKDASNAAAQLLNFFHQGADTPPGSKSGEAAQGSQRPTSVKPAPSFLGDTNPEGILVEATMAPVTVPASAQDDGQPNAHVGVLSPVHPHLDRSSSHKMEGSTATIDTSSPSLSVPCEEGIRLTVPVQDTARFAELAQTLLNRALAQKVLPSETDWQVLRELYLAKIHPILPIFDKTTLTELPQERPLRELVQATICLAAGTDPEALPYLAFRDTSLMRYRVPFNEYSQEMANFITRKLDELHTKDQLPLVLRLQVMAVTSFFWQPSKTTERFEPMSLFAKLVSFAHTHGIHLDVLAKAKNTYPTANQGVLGRIFKCLYAIDRLLAVSSGRPILFHNYDSVRIPAPEKCDPPSFRLFISLIVLLDHVIELYRPEPKVSYVDVPVFERLVLDAEAVREPENILGQSRTNC